MKHAIFAAVLALLPNAGHAQQVLAEYYTMLSVQDMFNSRGVRLTDIGAVLQQDRANMHRFGRPDQSDQGDPYFGSRQMRAQIPDLYYRGPGAQPYIVQAIHNGRAKYVLVRVIGFNGRPDYIEVYEGAG